MELKKTNPESKRNGPNPMLFYIMLGIIVAGILVFLVLIPSHVRSGGGKTTAPPTAQH